MTPLEQAWPKPPIVRLDETKPSSPAPSTDWKMKVLTTLENLDLHTLLLLTIVCLQLVCISYCRQMK